MFFALVASAFIPFLPMLAIHLLIHANLMYDISQLSLLWDKMYKEFPQAAEMGREKYWSFYAAIGPTSSIFDITTLR